MSYLNSKKSTIKKLLLILFYFSIFFSSCKEDETHPLTAHQDFLEKYLGDWEFSRYTSTSNPYGTSKDTTIWTDKITYGTLDSTLLIPFGPMYTEELKVNAIGEMSDFPAHYNYWTEGYFGVEVVTGNTILYIETTSGSPFQQTNQKINGQKIE